MSGPLVMIPSSSSSAAESSMAASSRPSERSSSTAAPSPKRLRSCLSPTRSRPSIPYSTCSSDEGYFPFTPMTSRSTSFSSAEGSEDRWRRSKSVRWEGEEEGSAVTSYYSTWSALEYDRSPLEPPSEGERACVLPERGSRCLSPVTCFLNGAVFADPDEFESVDIPLPHSITLDLSSTMSDSESSTESEGESDHDEHRHEIDEEEEDDDAGEQCDEDREWEECMERRRMMFATMQASSAGLSAGAGGPCGAFEGYTSLSAALADVLRSSSPCGGPSTPLEGMVDHLPLSISLSVSLPNHDQVDEVDDLLRTPELSSSRTGDSPPESMLGSPATTLQVPRIVFGRVGEEPTE